MIKSISIYSALLVLSFSSGAQERGPYATNAIATVNMSVVSLKSEKENLPQTREALVNQTKTMLSEAISHSFQFNNKDETLSVVNFIKKNKLENEFKKALASDIPQALNRAQFETEWKLYESFINSSQGVGLLDQNEYREMREKLVTLQSLRAQKNKKPEWAKNDLKLIAQLDEKYRVLRPVQLQKSKVACQEEIDWSASLPQRKGQTDTGWCYAFAYADYLESTQKQSVSSADLVLQYRTIRIKEERDNYNRRAALYNRELLKAEEELPLDYIYQGGELEKIFYKKTKMSLCPEESLRSEARDESGQPVAMGYVIDWINELGSEFDKGHITKAEIIKKLEEFKYQQIFPNAQIKSVLNQSEDKRDLYIRLAETTCKDKRIDITNTTSDWIMQGYTFTYVMDKALDKLSLMLQNQPVVISVNDNFLYKENIWGKGTSSNHIILVTGKRWNEETQHCEFKIRNSQTTYANKEERLWYSDTELLRNLDEIYIKPLLPTK